MDILAGLNPKQKESVKATSGPVLVIAGPGSGKTKALTHRVAYLIENGIHPQNILAVTFTNKAAEEMRSRITRLLSSSHSPEPITGGLHPLIGTFHSICARILRMEARSIGYISKFSIYDEEDALKLIKNLMKGLKIDQKQHSPQKIRATISSLKNKLIAPEDYEIEAEGLFEKEISKIYHSYQSALRKHAAMDFDDLLMKTVELFEKNPNILKKYQSQFKYILIDEFQDTNLGQYKIANYLAQYHRNFYCIGDLDQSIYSFRGADCRNILHLEKDWPDLKIINLEQNYRSVQNILDAANGVISKNTNRKDKKLWTNNGAGEPVVAKEADNEMGEGEFIISKIEEHIRSDKFKLRDFVVLYRTNAQSRAIEEAFLGNGLPYKIIGGIKFYQRKEIKDILAWLRLCLNSKDMIAISRVRDMPARFLKRNNESKSKSQIIDSLIENFAEKSKALKPTELLEYIIKNTGFEEYLRDGTERGEERWDNVREFLSVASKYDPSTLRVASGQASSGQATLGLEGVRQLVEEAALAQEADGVEYEKDLVNLMTLHSVKGLEFPVVFIAGCEQGLLPHARALFGSAENDLEEERRLFYVGITRAKQRLYLIFTERRMLFGKTQSNPPSEFLRDIPRHLIKFIPAEEEQIIELD